VGVGSNLLIPFPVWYNGIRISTISSALKKIYEHNLKQLLPWLVNFLSLLIALFKFLMIVFVWLFAEPLLYMSLLIGIQNPIFYAKQDCLPIILFVRSCFCHNGKLYNSFHNFVCKELESVNGKQLCRHCTPDEQSSHVYILHTNCEMKSIS
jgi:hypothetical protein